MVTLTEFLLARIAEDEASVVSSVCICPTYWHSQPDCPERVLAECAAKRAIVELLAVTDRYESDGNAWATCCHLATVYTDHPDYDPSWAA